MSSLQAEIMPFYVCVFDLSTVQVHSKIKEKLLNETGYQNNIPRDDLLKFLEFLLIVFSLPDSIILRNVVNKKI